ncbi:HNH endonuclease [Corynebacterium kroppenstedtii]|uniref:HNH endonuclease n=1 Tax=Corynebacterium sp. PCR 32 TaxID=3351342 RepID=UPI003750678A
MLPGRGFRISPYCLLTQRAVGRDRNGDFSRASTILDIDEEYRRQNNLVWHHHDETERMQLIPHDLHKVVRHSGGWANWGRNT